MEISFYVANKQATETTCFSAERWPHEIFMALPPSWLPFSILMASSADALKHVSQSSCLEHVRGLCWASWKDARHSQSLHSCNHKFYSCSLCTNHMWQKNYKSSHIAWSHDEEIDQLVHCRSTIYCLKLRWQKTDYLLEYVTNPQPFPVNILTSISSPYGRKACNRSS